VSNVAQDWVRDRTTLTGGPFQVLLTIADHANDAGKAWPTVETIARRSHLSRSTVLAALAVLEAGQFITIRRRYRQGRQINSVYLLHVDAEARRRMEAKRQKRAEKRRARGPASGPRTPTTPPRNSLNAVGGDQKFKVTERRRRLIEDTMVTIGEAHNVTTMTRWLESQHWAAAARVVRRLCGLQAAVRETKRRPDDVDAVLLQAGIRPVDDATWQGYLAGTLEAAGHGPGCRYEASGYCDRHGLREPASLSNAG